MRSGPCAPHDLPPQVAARRLAAENIPLYTFTFGKSGGSERADLAIDDLVTNETIFAETPTEVRGQLAAEGYANQQVKVQLLWETADENGSRRHGAGRHRHRRRARCRSCCSHTPRTPGEYKVTLRVEPREGELVTTNNEVSTFVTVRAGGINVLYLVGAKRIGGGPGPEQRFVRAALARSPDIVVERRLINYDPPGDRSCRKRFATADFDVVILDDVDVQGLSPASWQAIAERVRSGVGLMMIGGYHSFGPGGFRDSPLADVLPINIGPAQRQNFGEPLRQDVQLAGPGADAAGGAARDAASDHADWRGRSARQVGGQGERELAEALDAAAAAGWGESDRARRAEAQCAGAGRGG